MAAATGDLTVDEDVTDDPSERRAFAKVNRVLLIDLFNQVAGPPHPPMRALQDEFIHDRMEPAEAAAFVNVCEGLMSVVFSTGELPR
jgi:hypothetical protein